MKKLLLLSIIPFNVFASTIAIDVGHSLNSPGAISSYGETEFSYNKEMAMSIARHINQNNNRVNIIGYSGEPIKLEERSNLANGSSLLISVHHDSIPIEDLSKWNYNGGEYLYNDNVSGFGVFVSTKNPNLEKSLKCAVNIANNLIKAGFKPNYYHNQTKYGKKRELFFKNLPVYQYDNLVVLKKSDVPAILIESGVIINRKESLWIKDSDVRNSFGHAVSIGVQKCLE